MALYRVEADLTDGGHTVKDGVTAVIVSANDVANAKLVAAATTPNGLSQAAWAAATVTEITAPTTGLEDFRLRIQVQNTTTGSVVASVTVTGAAAATMDSLGALAETAFNATSSISGAAYTAGTNTLIIAAGSGTDDLGDHKIFCELLPPTDWENSDIAMTAFIGTITDEGVSTADLTVVFVDAATPGLIADYAQ